MDRDRVWDHTVAARVSLAATLADLSEDEWNHPSLCEGWRVRDVAAHLIMGPQLGWRRSLSLTRHAWRGYNGLIAHSGRVAGSAPVADILADYERYADLRQAPVMVTYVEPLVDALVHSQDIVRPLGRTAPLPGDAAALAAARGWTLALLMG
ncbi:MAG: maleylpyruvate isomerase family mycothiol-dependent enzyme, partial [Nocardioides sp.]